jgi:WD40 repeat protein/uncharacterized caspase-like protein
MRRAMMCAVFGVLCLPIWRVRAFEARAAEPTAWALVIGIGHYPQATEKNIDCPNAVGDARAVERWLVETAHWPREHVRLMTSDAVDPKLLPTLDNLKFAVEQWLPSNANTDDLIFIYYAGQALGIPEPAANKPDIARIPRDFLLPFDLRGREVNENTGWSLDQSLEKMRGIEADIFCCLDTSTFGRGSKPIREDAAYANRLLNRITQWPRRMAWIAADGGVAPDADQGKPWSPFRARLLNTLGNSSEGRNVLGCLKTLKADQSLPTLRTRGEVDPRLTFWPEKFERPAGRGIRPVLQRGHALKITGLLVRPEQNVFLSSSDDSTVRIWRSSPDSKARPELLRTLAEPIDGVSCLAQSDDGKWIAAGSAKSPQFWLWNSDGEPVPLPEQEDDSNKGRGNIQSIGFLPKSRDLVVVRQGSAERVDFKTKLPDPWFSGIPSNCSVAFATTATSGHDSAGAAAFDVKGFIHLLRADGQSVPNPDGLGPNTSALDLSADGRFLAVGTKDGNYAVFDLENPKSPLIKDRLPENSEVKVVRLKGSDWLAIANDERLWVIKPGKPGVVARLDLKCPIVRRVEFSDDGRFLAAISLANDTDSPQLWSLPQQAGNGAEKIDLEESPSNTAATKLAFAKDGRALFVGFEDGSIRSWPLEGSAPKVVASKPRSTPADPSQILSISVSPDGRQFVQICQDKAAFLFNFDDRSATRLDPNHTWNSLSFLPDGRLVGTLDYRSLKGQEQNDWLNRPVEFDLEKDEIKKGTYLPPEGWNVNDKGLDRMVVSADGKWVAAAPPRKGSDKNEILVWKISDGRQPAGPFDTFPKGIDPIEAFALAPSGGWLVECTRETATIHALDREPKLAAGDVQTLSIGDPEMPKIGDQFTAAEFRPDPAGNGRSPLIALGTEQSGVLLWEPKGKAQRHWSLGGKFRDEVSTIRFSDDGRWLVAAGADKRFRAWDLKDPVKPVPVEMKLADSRHDGVIKDLRPWPKLAMIASASDDSTVRFWSLEQRKHIGTLAFSRAGMTDRRAGLNWVAYTPEGQFDCTPGGKELVRLVQKDKLIRLEQAVGAYLDQELLVKIATDQVRPAESVDPKPKEPPTPPSLVLSSPDLALETNVSNDPEISIDVEFSVPNLKDLRLYNNDVPARGEGDFFDDRGDGLHFRTKQVPLVPGENRFRAVASLGDGIEGSSSTLYVQYNGAERPPRVHVVALGIDKYEKAGLKLDFAVKDAEDIANRLKALDEEENGKNLAVPRVQILRNHEVDEVAVKAAFETLQQNVKGHPNDKVVIFIAGHTEQKAGRFGLLLSKPDQGEDSLLYYSTILGKLGQLDALQRLVIVDGCQTDKLASDLKVKALMDREARGIEKDLLRYPTRYILASKNGEPAFENENLKHGLLTYALLHGLGDGNALAPASKLPKEQFAEFALSADQDGDGKITTKELNLYASTRLPMLAAVYPAAVRGKNVANVVPANLLRRGAKSVSLSLDLSEPSFDLVKLRHP